MKHAGFDHEVQETPFRNSVGKRITRSLFLELDPNPEHPYVKYTLKDVEWRGYPSLYRLYMDLGDLTEYEFATTYFESWEHWNEVCTIREFIPYLLRWRQELALLTKSQIVKNLKQESEKGSFQPNKILLEFADQLQQSMPQAFSTTKRGRPSKDELNGELQRRADETERLHEDFERITNGGAESLRISSNNSSNTDD